LLLPFTIELDGLDQAGYNQAVSAGLYAANYKKGDGNVLSSRCLRCDTVVIASVEKACACCGNLYIEVKQTDEEWIVCDTEEVPAQFVGEYDLSSDFFAYSEFMATTHLEAAVIDAGLACGLDLLQIEDAYQGSYDSDTDLADYEADALAGFIKRLDISIIRRLTTSDLEVERMAYALFVIKCDLKNLGFDPR
jgi:antirestriction protein